MSMPKKKNRIAIFASGSGTNAENISNYFQGHDLIEISRIYTNNPKAGVIGRAHRMDIPCVSFSKQHLNSGLLLADLKNSRIDGIVLAGFMQLIPSSLIEAYPERILNIHPSLLPKYGGKGMYGDRVHKAVIESDEKESGITIHLVNEHYDEGKIVMQVKVDLEDGESPETLASKIHNLEYEHYPKAIERIFS
jgi:phosphoribosylglycinamide formyltransferase-1